MNLLETITMNGLRIFLDNLDRCNKTILLEPIRYDFYCENIAKALKDSFTFSSFETINRAFPYTEITHSHLIKEVDLWY